MNDARFKATYEPVTDLRVGDELVVDDSGGYHLYKVVSIEGVRNQTLDGRAVEKGVLHLTAIEFGQWGDPFPAQIWADLYVLVSYREPVDGRA